MFLCLVFSCFRVCLLLHCGHLLGRADLLALVGDVNCIFVTFLCGILGQVWYLIVSFPDHCHVSSFEKYLAPISVSMVSSILGIVYASIIVRL